MGCAHTQFETETEVTRILDGSPEDKGGELVAFACEVRVRCVDCGEPFGWRGVPCGISNNGPPMRDPEATTLRAWLVSPSELALAGPLAGMVVS